MADFFVLELPFEDTEKFGGETRPFHLYCPVEGQIRPVKDILEMWDGAEEGSFSCFAFVTPNGDWLGKGDMGMFGFACGTMNTKEWWKRCKEIFEKFSDHIAISVDCHI